MKKGYFVESGNVGLEKPNEASKAKVTSKFEPWRATGVACGCQVETISTLRLLRLGRKIVRHYE